MWSKPVVFCRLLPRPWTTTTIASGLPQSTSSSSIRRASTASFAIGKLFPDQRSHEDLYRFSIQKPQDFWGRIGKSELKWMKDFDNVMDCDMRSGTFKWFEGGKLNAAANCLDRHDPSSVALIWEQDEPGQHVTVTYGELSEMVGSLGNALKNRGGVKPGDVVAIYMPVMPLAVAAMLACARIGAIHTVIFAGFSPESIASRIQDSKAVAVITADEAVRAGKRIPLKQMMDKALEHCPSIKTVFVAQRTGVKLDLKDNEFYINELSESANCSAEPRSSDDHLFLLYTSGSTGKPKGIAHSTAGYLAYAALTHKVVFNYVPGDIFGCVADIGWITGHSYVVYGPLLNGATTVLFESTPTYPDPGRYWETVQRLKINQFYGAPTAIRLLMKYDNKFVLKYDRSSLKTLGSVGEPINIDAWNWFHDVVGEKRCDLVDTWWQTETGGICISPRPSEERAEIVAGKPMRPMFGIDPVLVGEKGEELQGNNASGALCLRTPWPGMARTVIGDHKRFIETYLSMYPGYYFTGDGALRDANGYLQITGRMDDVINVTGHRLGTAEVEDALATHPDVAEAAVVGFPHDIKGEGVYAYVILKKSAKSDKEELVKDMQKLVRNKIAGYAIPEHILFCRGLPKTRSGKIMRRILRKVAADKFDDLGDISTLSEPHIVEEIITSHKELKKGK